MKYFVGFFSCKEEKLIERDVASWQLQGEPTVLVTIAHIFNYFAPLMVSMPLNTSHLLQWNYLVLWPYWLRQSTLCVCGTLQCKVYLVEDVLMSFLLGILEGGGSVDEHPVIQQLLELFWLLMEVTSVCCVYLGALGGLEVSY